MRLLSALMVTSASPAAMSALRSTGAPQTPTSGN